MQSYEDFRLNTTFFLYCSPSYYDKCRKCTPFCLTPFKNVVSSAKIQGSRCDCPVTEIYSTSLTNRTEQPYWRSEIELESSLLLTLLLLNSTW